MPPPAAVLNLSAIDEAFGERADLYRDVLRLKSDASTQQIQQAYFSRRDELFQMFADFDHEQVPTDSPQRYQLERQMDALVMALRILGDPTTRIRYDEIRRDRVVGRKPLLSIPAATYSSPRSMDHHSAEYDEGPLGVSTSLSISDKSSKSNSGPRRQLKSALKKVKSSEDPSSSERSVTISVEYIHSVAEKRDGYVYDDPPLAIGSKDGVSPSSKASRVSPRKSKSIRAITGGKGNNNNSVPKGQSPTRVTTKRKSRKVVAPPSPTRTKTKTTTTHSPVREERRHSPVREERRISPVREERRKSPKRVTKMMNTPPPKPISPPPLALDDELVANDDTFSLDSRCTTLTLIEARRSIFQVVKDEIVGVFEDTSRSVEQVFNAFTLQDDEIAAVFGRIDKAKQQMAVEFKP